MSARAFEPRYEVADLFPALCAASKSRVKCHTTVSGQVSGQR